MLDLHKPSVIAPVLEKHGFSLSKGLGQNFIINGSVCPKMAEMCGADEHTAVLEIGPGIGVLTKELSLRAKKVVSIEIDKRLPAILAETLEGAENVKIILADFMELDLKKLFAEEFAGMDVVVCANLPYYITSPIIMKLLEEHAPVKSITVMVQKEAAERITAAPGTRQGGAISLAIRYYCTPRQLFGVSRGSFMPAPSVDSAVIKLDLLQQPPVKLLKEESYFKVVKAGFSQRRKMLTNCLSSGLGIDKAEIAAAVEKAGVKLTARPEELTVQQFADIANGLVQAGLL